MKSLAERHIERAQRKADNAAESPDLGIGGNVGAASIAIATAQEAFAGLTDEQKGELVEAMGSDADGFASNLPDAYGGAFDSNGNLRTAGIGVVNPLIAPVTAAERVEGEAGTAGAGSALGWGKAAESDLSGTGDNMNGKVLDEVAGGEGGSTKPPVTDKMTVAELEAIAKAEGADLTGVTNNAGRVSAIEAKRAQA
jgi:hypothetical protein